MERWIGKTAIVTGASEGVGAAICLRLANEGMLVVGFTCREQMVQKLQRHVCGCGKIFGVHCDVGKPEDIATAFDWLERKVGGVDLLVNNASVLPIGQITEACTNATALLDEEILQMIDVNITGMILCTRYAVASMKKRLADGHIVNINSVAGHYIPSAPVANVYPMTKHAVTAFSTALNHELAHARARIKTTSLSPGMVDTDIVNQGPEKDTHAESSDRHFQRVSARLKKPVPGANRTRDCGLATKPPMLHIQDVVDALIYAVSRPPDVNVLELTITVLNEKRW